MTALFYDGLVKFSYRSWYADLDQDLVEILEENLVEILVNSSMRSLRENPEDTLYVRGLCESSCGVPNDRLSPSRRSRYDNPVGLSLRRWYEDLVVVLVRSFCQ